MTASLPFISVLVPAYNRPDALRRLLLAIEDQSYPPYRFEVIVCDDGSTPSLLESIDPRGYSFPLKIIEKPHAGAASARNHAIRQAAGTIAVFTHDDCIPDAGWLDAIAEGFQSPNTHTLYGPTHANIPPIQPFLLSAPGDRTHGPSSANLAVRRDFLVHIKCFDATLSTPRYEDEDLAIRLQSAHGPLAWSETMRVEHTPRPGTIAQAWQTAAATRDIPYLAGKHPGFGYDIFAGLLKRSAIKSVLVFGILAPLFVPAPFGWLGPLGWVALLTWQALRLKPLVGLAQDHGVSIPRQFMLWYLFCEWALDFKSLAAYVSGWAVRRSPHTEFDDEFV